MSAVSRADILERIDPDPTGEVGQLKARLEGCLAAEVRVAAGGDTNQQETGKV